MKNFFGIALLTVLCFSCSKKESATPAASEESASAPVAAAPATSPGPVPSAAPAGKPQAQTQNAVKSLEGTVDKGMTLLLQKFVREKGRMPQSILELSGATSDGFPLAPQGYIYAIDTATAQVKLVKQ